MRIAVTGSIATDHLMTFPGRFADSLVPGQLEKVSVSFLVEDLQVRRGGVAANISFGMAGLGLRPVLVGSVGDDFVDYRSWLERHGVDCSGVRVSSTQHTARFVCTTDAAHAQIASFYSGAMSEAREIELAPIAARVGGLDLVMVSPNDPQAMLRHTDECRTRGIPFAADPSQQLAHMSGPEVRLLVDGAAYLFTNDYEATLVEQRTGWDAAELLDRVGTRVVTRGKDGVRVERAGQPPLDVEVVPAAAAVDPTGVGDGFRAGFLAAVAWGLPVLRAAQLGSLVATHVIETVGPQEYEFGRAGALARFTAAYGDEATSDVAAHLRTLRP